uniref:Leucine rich repeat containing 73 n=1 Tax=Cyprinodon variegatus TaxID=28743 RepID=A0A3Q2CR28_CYPVA
PVTDQLQASYKPVTAEFQASYRSLAGEFQASYRPVIGEFSSQLQTRNCYRPVITGHFSTDEDLSPVTRWPLSVIIVSLSICAPTGLRELTLSANPRIGSKGWARFAIAVAHSSQLRVLNLDYNPLGDQIAAMLAVAVASSRTLEVLDLEGTGLTNQSAQVFLDMVENYPTSLRVLVLAENDISPELQQQISDLLSEGEEEDNREWMREPAGLDVALKSNCSLIPTDSGPPMVLLTSGLGESLLAETEM